MPSPTPEELLPEELLLGQFIPLHYHFHMLQDHSRMQPFRDALNHVVPRGGRVLELGGGTGVLSYFAAQRADKVWCVERNPALVQAARRFLPENHRGDCVEVVQADALTYLPPEPVDVVVCEMLHVGLIREKQAEILRSFRERYRARFGGRLPIFVPDTSLLAVQLLEQDFRFDGYFAPVPMFHPPGPQPSATLLSEPCIYSTIDYGDEIPERLVWKGDLVVTEEGRLNALGFLTKNFLAFVLEEQRAITWMMNQLILPLPEPIYVEAGDLVHVRFHYELGCPLEFLHQSLSIERQSSQLRLYRAA